MPRTPRCAWKGPKVSLEAVGYIRPRCVRSSIAIPCCRRLCRCRTQRLGRSSRRRTASFAPAKGARRSGRSTQRYATMGNFVRWPRPMIGQPRAYARLNLSFGNALTIAHKRMGWKDGPGAIRGCISPETQSIAGRAMPEPQLVHPIGSATRSTGEVTFGGMKTRCHREG
jgi:hypothetical protein